MNIVANFEHRASSSRGKHEGESSFALCDRFGRTRDNSQRQLPTDHDYAVPTREYQTDQSSLNLPRLLLALSSRKRKDNYKNIPTDFASVDMVTPYQGNGPNVGLPPYHRQAAQSRTFSRGESDLHGFRLKDRVQATREISRNEMSFPPTRKTALAASRSVSGLWGECQNHRGGQDGAASAIIEPILGHVATWMLEVVQQDAFETDVDLPSYPSIVVSIPLAAFMN